jgi:sporulation protein YlmC with PRC-barrel domain
LGNSFVGNRARPGGVSPAKAHKRYQGGPVMQKFARIAAAGLFAFGLPAASFAQDAKAPDSAPPDKPAADSAPKDQPMPPAADKPADATAKPDQPVSAGAPVSPTEASQPVPSAPGNPSLSVASVKMDGGIRASKIIGASVLGENNQDLGTVNDLVLDKDGKIVLGVISVGSVLGMGGKLVGEPFGQFQIGKDGKLTLPGANKETLIKQPGFAYSD